LDSEGHVARHKAEPAWADGPEHCAGSGAAPYQTACNLVAEAMANTMRQAELLAIEHLNTAVTENVDPHGHSWCRVELRPNAFRPVGDVVWMLGRILQTEAGTVQLCDAVGNLHPLPEYKTVRAARKAMLELRLAALDAWHSAALERAAWYDLKLRQWHPQKPERAVAKAAPAPTRSRKHAGTNA
jgi:hypothetical protein